MALIARHYQRVKNGVHALQALFIFIGAIITIAIYAKGGQNGGRINYYFVLCWLCIPALVYQTAIPIFQRTKRFTNPYTHAIIDILYTIFWFSAFVAVFVWTRDGSHAAKDWDGTASLCDKFAWGPTSKCRLGQATGAFAVIICIFFILTAALSINGVLYFRRSGSLPGYASKQPEPIREEEEQARGFSADMPEEPDERNARQPMHGEHDELPSIRYENDERQLRHHEDYEVSTLHAGPDESFDRESLISRERQLTPELPMHRERPLNWPKPPTPEMTLHQERTASWERPQTPDLPMGEGFYPVDTSYRGSGKTPYSPPQRHRSSETSDAGYPSALRIPVPPKDSNFIEDLEPEVYDPPQSSGTGSLSPLHIPNFNHPPQYLGAGSSRPPLNAVATGDSILLVGRKPLPQLPRAEVLGNEMRPEWGYDEDDVESRRPSTRRRRVDSFKDDNKFDWERSSYGSQDRIRFPEGDYGR